MKQQFLYRYRKDIKQSDINALFQCYAVLNIRLNFDDKNDSKIRLLAASKKNIMNLINRYPKADRRKLDEYFDNRKATPLQGRKTIRGHQLLF
jgi:hypothetical protein